MNDTCKAKDCKLHDLLGGEPEQCPNFIQTCWTSDSGEVKPVKDCAPVRTMLMVQQLMNQTLGLQQAQEQQRNESHIIINVLKKALSHRIQDTTKRLDK